MPLPLVLLQPLSGGFRRQPDHRGRHGQATETAEQVVGGVAKGTQGAGQTDQGPQATAEVVALQVVGGVEGAVALMALGAVVVGATDLDFTRESQPAFGPITDEAGVGGTEGADATGAVVPLFLLASRPA